MTNKMAAPLAANFIDNQNASMRFSDCCLLSACFSVQGFLLSDPALFLFLVTRPVWNSETILGEYGSTRSTLYKFQKCPRGGPIFCVFQDNCSLFKRGMHLCWNVPFLATGHRRPHGKGHRNNS